jgi:hypothetical protein
LESGNLERARGILIGDFRHGGELDSLAALARVELGAGRIGMATLHHAHLVSLDAGAIADPETACAAFRIRAAAAFARDEPLLADADLRRVHALCGVSRDSVRADAERAFATQVRASAEARVRALRRSPEIGGSSGVPGPARVDAEIVAARQRGALELARHAIRRDLSITPEELVGALAAEHDAPLQPGSMVRAEDVEHLLGDATAEAVEVGLAGLDDAHGSYVRLRLRSFLGTPAGEVAPLVERSMRADDDQVGVRRAVRTLITVGDLDAAELVLVSALRGARRESSEEARRVPLDPASSEATPHAVVDPKTLLDWELWVARLQEARGREVAALGRLRDALGRLRALDPALARQRTLHELRRSLRAGRLWSAWAIADAGGLADQVEPVVLAGLDLSHAACTGRCDEDRARVERLLGPDWLTRHRPEGARRDPPVDQGGVCPDAVSLLAPGASGAFADALGDPELAQAPEVAAAIVAEIESDPTLSCPGPVAVELLHAYGHRLTLAALDERLRFAPRIESADTTEVAATIAVAAGQDDRAEMLFTDAAARSEDPGSVWRRAAAASERMGALELAARLHANAQGHRLDAQGASEALRLRLRLLANDGAFNAGVSATAEAVRAQIEAVVRSGHPATHVRTREVLRTELEAAFAEVPPSLAEVLETQLPWAPSRGKVDPVPVLSSAPASSIHAAIGVLLTGEEEERWAAAQDLLARASGRRAAVIDRLATGPWCWGADAQQPQAALPDSTRRLALLIPR